MNNRSRLGYTTANDVIELKGRVACEISTGDELLLTELIFNGAFNPLTVEQTAALLSCFVFEEKVRAPVHPAPHPHPNHPTIPFSPSV